MFVLLFKLAIRNKLTSIFLPVQRRNHIVGPGNEFRECLYIPIWLLGRGILMHMALLPCRGKAERKASLCDQMFAEYHEPKEYKTSVS